MKKFIYYTFSLFLLISLYLSQNINALASDVIINNNNSTNNSYKVSRPASAASSKGYDKRLDNSQTIVDIRVDLQNAMAVHNYGALMLSYLVNYEGFKNLIASHKYAKEILQANEQCNINLLKPYYHNPSEVWDKVSTWAYNTQKAGASNIEALTEEVSDIALDMGESFVYDNNAMSKNMTVARNSWDIGNRVLVNLYANQSAWGKKKQPFPLWGDQKYFFDMQWNHKYGEIKRQLVATYRRTYSRGGENFCEVEGWVYNVPGTGPTVPDIYKYDHEDYDAKIGTQAVLKAHNEYVKLIKKVPSGLNLSVMHAPQAPLPPLKEAIYKIQWTASNAFERNFTPYPGLPKVWQDMLNSKLSYFNRGFEEHRYKMIEAGPYDCPAYVHGATGPNRYSTELADYINVRYIGTYDKEGNGPSGKLVRGLTPSEVTFYDFKSFKRDEHVFINNRIQTYLDNRNIKERLDPIARDAERGIEHLKKEIKDKLATFDIILKDDFDLSNAQDYNDVIEQIKLKQAEYIAKAKENYNTLTPTDEHLIERDLESYKLFTKVFDALDLDKEDVAQVNFDTIDTVPELILQANAKRAISWETILELRKPPEFPTVGCPIY